MDNAASLYARLRNSRSLKLIVLALLPALLIASSVRAGSGLDDSTVLLLHGNGLASIPFSFRDSSFSDHTITTNGDAHRATDKFSQSGFFDGTGDYLSLANNSDWEFGTGDFTLDFWIRRNGNQTSYARVISTFVNPNGWHIAFGGSGLGTTNALYFAQNTSAFLVSSTVIPDATWTHIALTRSGNTFRLFINGTQTDSVSDSRSITSAGSGVGVAADSNGNDYFSGQIDEVRISKGVARWTSNFTPPTSPYSSDANTSLLLHMDGSLGSTTFTDSSGSPKTVTANGDAKISLLSKFGGDGVCFDGSGDYLSIASSASGLANWFSGDHTIDYWILPRAFGSSVNGGSNVFGHGNTGNGVEDWSFGPISTGVVRFYYYNGAVQTFSSTTTLATNVWSHLAFVKSGTSLKIYINGVERASATLSGTPSNSAVPTLIGQVTNAAGFNGCIDELRVSSGVARWTANFTPPTEQYALPGVTFTGSVKFLRNIAVIDKLSKGAGTFVIDHPQKPRTHLLYHAFVESPDAKNLYDGIAELNEHGEVIIPLPDYFEALNKDFRYQYFPLDEAMPNLHVKQKVKDNAFIIAGGKPGGRISWQITGIRHDPYIEANPVIVEVDKGPDQLVDRGECLHDVACQ